MVDEASCVGTFPSIMLTSLVQKRYFPRFSLICLAVAGRPKYSITSEPLGMRSWVKRPLPLCDRRTVSRKGARINLRSWGLDAYWDFSRPLLYTRVGLGPRTILATAALTLGNAKLLEHGPADLGQICSTIADDSPRGTDSGMRTPCRPTEDATSKCVAMQLPALMLAEFNTCMHQTATHRPWLLVDGVRSAIGEPLPQLAMAARAVEERRN